MTKKTNLVLREKICISQLPMGSIFKIGFISNIFVWGSVGAIAGVRALFDSGDVVLGMETTTGVGGFFIWLLIALLVSVIGSVVLTLGGLVAGVAARDVGFGQISYTISSSQARKRQVEARNQVLKELERKMQKEVPDGRLW